jgi:8-oxo-dGTP pyrophosphatase MutT (NUDIX family)
MGYPLATVTLSPWLFLQGKQVRKNTPLLPEAVGERAGCLGKGPRLNLLILGDSAAAGVGVSYQSQALTGILVEQLKRSYSGRWRLLAKSGRKLVGLLRQVEQGEVESYDVVVVSIGINDVTAGTSPRLWKQQLNDLLNLITHRFAPTKIILSAIPPIQCFPALPQPLRWYMGLRAKRLNAASQSLLSVYPICHLLTVDLPLTPNFMAQDGFHPNEAANRLWAQYFLDVIVDPIPSKTIRKRLAACCLFIRDGRVLLGHRSPGLSYYPDVWDVIGGHAENSETPEQAMLRESQEEIACTPTKYSLLTIEQEPNPEQNGPGEFHFYLITEWTGFPSIKNHEHDQLAWFNLAEARQLELADCAYLRLFDKIDQLK